jgi:hypothetical protein
VGSFGFCARPGRIGAHPQSLRKIRVCICTREGADGITLDDWISVSVGTGGDGFTRSPAVVPNFGEMFPRKIR